MAWAKFDDRWDDHRKIKLAWHRSRAAVAIHAMAITYSARHETDGFIDEVWLLERLPDQVERDEAVSALVDVGLFDEADQGYWVRDFLEYNPSREDQQEKRRRDAERKARGRSSGKRTGQNGDDDGNPTGVHAGDPRTPDGGTPESARIPSGVPTDSHDTDTDPSARPDPTRPDPTPSVSTDVETDTARGAAAVASPQVVEVCKLMDGVGLPFGDPGAVDKLIADHPDVDIVAAAEKCVEWVKSSGTRVKHPVRALLPFLTSPDAPRAGQSKSWSGAGDLSRFDKPSGAAA